MKRGTKIFFFLLLILFALGLAKKIFDYVKKQGASRT